MFRSLAGIEEKKESDASLIRPAEHNKNLQVLKVAGDVTRYMEVNESLEFLTGIADSTAQMKRLLGITKDFTTDSASVIVKDKTGTFRLPKTSGLYDSYVARGARELESERYMLNAHGTLYEVGRES